MAERRPGGAGEERLELGGGGGGQAGDATGQRVERVDDGAAGGCEDGASTPGASGAGDDQGPGGGVVHGLDPVPGGAVGDAEGTCGEADRPVVVDRLEQCDPSGPDLGAVGPADPGLDAHVDGGRPGALRRPGCACGRTLGDAHSASEPAGPPSRGPVYHEASAAFGAESGRSAGSRRFWAQVAAFGAAWGAFEITLGATLHAFRIPFAGIALSALGAALLVAQRQLLPDRGASVATAAVAALCKSVSPDGLVFGPMVAMLVEGLLVEAVLLAAPRALLLAALAGALCAVWSAFQKLLTQVVFFGSDVLELYLAALRTAGRAFGIPSGAGWAVLGAFCLLVLLVGAAGGLFGRAVGREAARRLAAWEGADER